MPTYYLWNIGCQMNKAESDQLAECLDGVGYRRLARPDDADLVLLNTCVVRGNAEERVRGELSRLKGLKALRPGMSVAVTGCFVGGGLEELRERFPHVDLFFPAGQVALFRDWLSERVATGCHGAGVSLSAGPAAPAAYVPIIRGCNNFCSYCIVPYRRGREISLSPEEVVARVQDLAGRGAREVTLLGQNVNSYGKDLLSRADLTDLLAQVNGVPGIERIRFLTSHPRDVDEKFVDAMARLDRVCKWISLPVQAGDDRVLQAMRRGYTVEEYRRLVKRMRARIPGLALSTDVIVGFPGETEADFGRTVALLSELRFDTVHVAAYSVRPGTLAARTMPDDVLPEQKGRRLQEIEEMQERISAELNSSLVGKRVEVLVERRAKGKWEGRTRTNKLVFFSDAGEWTGRLADVEVTSASPWSLQGKVALRTEVGAR
ncbi:MAG: tRNA (N6-isopentenyl adenosine(37)-C2)-methylthiotransferase MiaB [Chloroflexi bacterium]|nr:tRNA (N6-isopentenyl adenosine(37)-C2)-methylthiotransferase MiaB [Chloroflexota bacterium]